jgi:hypothetical protein
MDNIKVEVPHQSNQPENDKSKFNWVTGRSSCSLPKIFQVLRLQVEEDVKTRNALRPKNSPYEFSVKETGSDFTVFYEAKDVSRSVIFSLAEHGILVRGDKGNEMFEVGLTYTDKGECQLIVNKEPREFWQVRRMALEDLLFQGH